MIKKYGDVITYWSADGKRLVEVNGVCIIFPNGDKYRIGKEYLEKI